MGGQAPQDSIWRTKTAPMAQPAPTRQNTGFGLTGDMGDDPSDGFINAGGNGQGVIDLGMNNTGLNGVTPALAAGDYSSQGPASTILRTVVNSGGQVPHVGAEGKGPATTIKQTVAEEQKNNPAPAAPAGGASDGQDGPPAYPDYKSMLNGDNQLLPGFTSAAGPAVSSRDVKASPINRSALDNLTQRGTALGPSPWLTMMQGRIGGMQAGYSDDAVRGARQSTTSAMDQAGMRGGLSGGASARLAGRGLENSAAGQQAASKWGADARLQAGMEDERTKLQIPPATPPARAGTRPVLHRRRPVEQRQHASRRRLQLGADPAKQSIQRRHGHERPSPANSQGRCRTWARHLGLGRDE
jgi:hypothetical protein